MLKISNYNHFLPLEDGRLIAYNCYAGNLGVMEKEKYQQYLFLKEQENELKALHTKPEYKELINRLRLAEFVLNDQIGEKNKTPLEFLISRYNDLTLSLILGLTSDCNFHCPYCKITPRRFMLPEVVDGILNFAEEKAKHLKEIKVRFFGGEPLLAWDILEDFSTTFLEMSKEYKLSYSADMISNGYLLTKDVGKKLKELNVENVQVTLDGPPKTHNSRRTAPETEDTYSIILDNIAKNQDNLHITIRINLEENHTLEDVAKILADLREKNLSKIKIYFAFLDAQVQTCVDFAGTCLHNLPLDEKMRNFCKLAMQSGFRLEKIPQSLMNLCYAHYNNLFIFDPKGYFYKCTYEIGNIEKSFGSVNSDMEKFNPNLFPYLFWDPFKDLDCLNCSVSPLCQGGCAYKVLKQGKAKGQDCQKWYDSISSMLELIYLAKMTGLIR
jgi:uncharacterized protein